ncbi:DMT family transporter [Pseudomonas khavaziana]|uniref:DMT family transporter n=1 Tax=Pseudomonas khavaziana TaxID=2842351 RepID=UPI001C3DE237|nr:EamA family transporter [Pseudomonas khavaziana]MBV4480707.1 DMT family transporter [Pseudomonas khavaziana]
MKSSWGPTLIILSGILWGFSAFTKKYLLVYVDPLFLNVINSAFVCISLVSVWFRPSELWKSFRQAPYLLIAMAFFGNSIGTSMLYIAIDHLSLSVASVVGKLQPVFVIVCAYVFLKERLTRTEILLSVVSILGAFLVAVPEPMKIFETAHMTIIGLLAALASALGWAFSGVIGRRLTIMDASPSAAQMTFFRYFIGSSLLIPLVDFSSYSSTVAQWPYQTPFLPTVFILTFVTVTVPTWAFYKGLKHVSASYASVLELSSPITAVLLGMIFLSERLNESQLIGVALVVLPILALENLRMRHST